jgi:hypothetical protein
LPRAEWLDSHFSPFSVFSVSVVVPCLRCASKVGVSEWATLISLAPRLSSRRFRRRRHVCAGECTCNSSKGRLLFPMLIICSVVFFSFVVGATVLVAMARSPWAVTRHIRPNLTRVNFRSAACSKNGGTERATDAALHTRKIYLCFPTAPTPATATAAPASSTSHATAATPPPAAAEINLQTATTARRGTHRVSAGDVGGVDVSGLHVRERGSTRSPL